MYCGGCVGEEDLLVPARRGRGGGAWLVLDPVRGAVLRPDLVQVRGPSDMFQYIIKDMAMLTNITNAAILFDESFSKSLLFV